MKNNYLILASAILCAGLVPAYSPTWPGAGHAQYGTGHMAKLFGGITAYSATMETQSKDSSGNAITMPSKIFSPWTAKPAWKPTWRK